MIHSGDLFEVFWHHEVQKIDKISLNHFSENLLLGATWAQSGLKLRNVISNQLLKRYLVTF